MKRKRYQAGGLAAATGSSSAADIISSFGKDEGESPEPGLIQSTLKRARMNRGKAIQSLQAGRDALMQQKADKSGRWLALAQGMLAPTRTGGFGESLGQSAGLLREEQGREREAELNRATRIADIEQEMRDVEANLISQETALLRAAKTGATGSMKDPVGSGRVVRYMDENGDEVTVLANRVWDPTNEEFETHIARGPDGEPLIALHSMDAEQAGAVTQAKSDAKTDSEARGNLINAAHASKPVLSRAYKALELIDEVEAAGGTGGVQNFIQRAREFLGDAAQDVTDRGQLENLMADQLFQTLMNFKGQLSNMELQKAERVSTGNTRPGDINRAILQDLVMRLEYEIRSARRIAGEYGTDFQKTLMEAPLPGIGQQTDRGAATGLPTEEGLPFDEPGAAPIERAPGDIGTAENPWEPVDLEEARDIMENQAQSKDVIINPSTGEMMVIP